MKERKMCGLLTVVGSVAFVVAVLAAEIWREMI
jgi:hypothetical protein